MCLHLDTLVGCTRTLQALLFLHRIHQVRFRIQLSSIPENGCVQDHLRKKTCCMKAKHLCQELAVGQKDHECQVSRSLAQCTVWNVSIGTVWTIWYVRCRSTVQKFARTSRIQHENLFCGQRKNTRSSRGKIHKAESCWRNMHGLAGQSDTATAASPKNDRKNKR